MKITRLSVVKATQAYLGFRLFLSPELWKILEDSIKNPAGTSAANIKKRKDMITIWKDDDQVLALVVRSAMSPALQDRIIYDDIRHSGRLILEELDKVFEPLGETARIRMMAQLYACKPEPGESIIDFLCRIRKLVDLLAAAGAPVSNQVLHEIIPKCIRDQPGMHGLASRWIQHKDQDRNIHAYIDQCRDELQTHPTQSFVNLQLYIYGRDQRRRGHFSTRIHRDTARDACKRGHV